MISNKLTTAVIVFAFNRPFHINRLLLSLNSNEEFRTLPCIFYIDGPRNSNDCVSISHVKNIILSYKPFIKSFKIILRKRNLGCKNNIINGINETLSVYDSAIILEDDLVVDRYFLKFMINSLLKFKNSNNVYHISGYSFINSIETHKSYFSRLMICWGWATWSDKWVKLNTNALELEGSFSKNDIYEFNIEGTHDFFRQLIENRAGILNTWAILWAATIFKHKGLCLVPSSSLVKNTGYDGSGERTGRKLVQPDFQENSITSFPNYIIEDPIYLEKLKLYFNNTNNILKRLIKVSVYFLPYQYQKSIMKIFIVIRSYLVQLSDIFFS